MQHEDVQPIEDQVIDPDPDPDPKYPGKETTIIDLLKQEYEEVASTKDTFIAIPGYDKTGLVAKYHLPEHGRIISQIADKVMRDEKDPYSRSLFIGMDLMINLCDGLYVKPTYSDVGEYVMLDPDDSGHPVDYGDPRLAEIIKADPSLQARGILRKLFGGNDTAIISHAAKLNRWLENTRADLSMGAWLTGE